ncbi:tRNA (adenosine(37)-N6)-threonylcarbamoyltransferase complex ATPase subunit type 1 TsaE [candidate division KSB1 bacterium]|nr:tRNA (adenosine(37)-N6)-threonylcarbamoyltransferase complex ATPase subunit type 1 TsaE [candidate division KSB1 bacterium]
MGIRLISQSEIATRRLGAVLAKQLRAGDVIALLGDLGSGKTCLTRGICQGLGVIEDVTSPTFVLINEYHGRLPVYHFDFYRLESLDEIWNLGIDDYINNEGICIIEWAERGAQLLPEQRIEIYLENKFESETETDRLIEIRSPRIQAEPFSAVKGLVWC